MSYVYQNIHLGIASPLLEKQGIEIWWTQCIFEKWIVLLIATFYLAKIIQGQYYLINF